MPLSIPRGASDRLQEASFIAEESLTIRIEDGHEAHLGDVEPLTEQVDSHDDVDESQPKRLDDLRSLDRIDLRMGDDAP